MFVATKLLFLLELNSLEQQALQGPCVRPCSRVFDGGAACRACAGDKKLPAVTAMAWLCVDANGSSALLQSDKWRVAEKLGIQARDLRLLDPQLSTTASPCAILCRER